MIIKFYHCKEDYRLIAEALRVLPGYDKPVEGYQTKSLINYDLNGDNENYMVHSILNDQLESGEETFEGSLKLIYIQQFHKNVRKNTTFGTCIITIPRIFDRDKEDFPDISEMNVQEARKAISRYYAKNQKVKDWLEAAVESFIKIINIRRDDIICASLHLDETTPHVHIIFFPAYIMLDKDGNIRKDEEGNTVYGCARSIVNRPFLKQFHPKMVAAMKERQMPYADAMITGKGYLFNPQKMSHTDREKAVTYMIEDEILESRINKGLISVEDALPRFHFKKMIQQTKEAALKKAQKEMEEMLLQKTQTKMQYDSFIFDIRHEFDEVAYQIANMKKQAIEAFRIEALGLSDQEIKTKITVLQDELTTQFRDFLSPAVTLIDNARNEIDDDNPSKQDDYLIEQETL